MNDYEGKMLEEKTGRKLEEHARRVKALIVTLGAQGSLIYAGGKRHEIPCAPAEKVVDPTGCGEATGAPVSLDGDRIAYRSAPARNLTGRHRLNG